MIQTHKIRNSNYPPLNMCQGVISMFCVFTWMALGSFDEFPKLLVFEE